MSGHPHSHFGDRPPLQDSTGQIKRRGFFATISGLLVGVFAAVARRAEAATGDPLICGQDNKSETRTTLTRITQGEHVHTTAFWAIAGDKDSFGLRGDGSGQGAGVFGNNTDTGPGIYGNSDGIGVSGQGPDMGVYGHSVGIGVYGDSDKGMGAVGVTANGVGVIGEATNKAIGYAGLFGGRVTVLGDFDVIGGAKSAVVRLQDGSLRRLYSLESPESWFEDFGAARLVNGSASVAIDPVFAATIRGDYHVFLTPQGDSNGLYVSSRHAGTFGVREQKGGTSTLSFSYRIVGKRKDIPGPRLPKVAPPPSIPIRHPRPVPEISDKRPMRVK